MELTRDNYYSYPAISNSSLSLLKKSPERFRKYMSGEYNTTPSASQNYGTMIHLLTLEPEKFDAKYLVFDESQKPVPDKDYRTKANKEWKKGIEEKALFEDKEIISLEEYKKACVIAENARSAIDFVLEAIPRRHKVEYEVPLLYTRKEFPEDEGLELKGLIDCLVRDEDGNPAAVIDLKTISDISKYKNHYKWYSYYRQLGFYAMLPSPVYPVDRFIVFVETDNLYETRIVQQTVSEAIMTNKEINSLLDAAKEALAEKQEHVINYLDIFEDEY